MRTIKSFLGGILLVLVGITACHVGAVGADFDTGYVFEAGFESAQPAEAIIEKVAEVYTSQVGVRELTGRNDGAEVEAYLAVTGFGKGYAWCAAFVSWSFKEAGVDALKSAWSPSWFPDSKVIYRKGKPLKIKPDKADVFGIYNTHLKRIAHVGFVDTWPPGDYLVTVEGNTNSAGSREGDGVYKKRRLKSNVHAVSRWIDRSV